MNVAVRYLSRTGNTKKVAEYIAEAAEPKLWNLQRSLSKGQFKKVKQQYLTIREC